MMSRNFKTEKFLAKYLFDLNADFLYVVHYRFYHLYFLFYHLYYIQLFAMIIEFVVMSGAF